MTMELNTQIEKLEKDFNDCITKTQEDLKEEIKDCNTKLKNEIREEVILVLDRRLDDKLDGMKEKQDQLNNKLNTLMGIMDKKKTKDRHKKRRFRYVMYFSQQFRITTMQQDKKESALSSVSPQRKNRNVKVQWK